MASEDGSSISSGDNSDIMEAILASRLVSIFRITKTFVRDGTMTYEYMVDAEEPDDNLAVMMDSDVVMEPVSQSWGWDVHTVNVPAGTHTFTWQYTKDYTGNEGADKAFIKAIQLEGTSYADLKCHTCATDMIQSYDSVCRFCENNQYAGPSEDSVLDYICHDCPADTYAPEGSIGEQSCLQKKACDTTDYNIKYSDCTNSTRTSTYFWIDPKTCNSEVDGSIPLPASEKSLKCGACITGYFTGHGKEYVNEILHSYS